MNISGKSTLMEMLNGVLPPTSGKALVNGIDIEEHPMSTECSVGFCPQQTVLFDQLTVGEHIEFFSILKGAKEEKAKKEAKKYVRLLNLEANENELVRTLSNNLKRILQLAIALCADSKVVLLDEATSGMDFTTRQTVYDLLQAEKGERAILLSTQTMEDADTIGDRIVVLVDGSLKCAGSFAFLKKRFNTGCRLICRKSDEYVPPDITFQAVRTIWGAKAQLHMEDEHEMVFSLPYEQDALHGYLKSFEQFRHNSKACSFRLEFTTMEEVFEQIDKMHRTSEKKDNSEYRYGERKKCHTDGDSRQICRPDGHFFLTGSSLWFNQFLAMLKKRSLHWFRSCTRWVLFNILVLFMFGSVLLAYEYYTNFNPDWPYPRATWPRHRISIDDYKAPKIIIDDDKSTNHM